MDNYLYGYLRATGRANPDRIGRALKPRTCQHCGKATVTGLDGDVAALPIICDPALLNPLGELRAVLQSVTTFQVFQHPAGYVITRRQAGGITAHPAGTVPVLPEHRCGLTYAPDALAPGNDAPAPLPDEPPF